MKEKKTLLEQLNVNLDSIQDQKVKETIQALFNLIEAQATTIRNLQEENQRLRDENNRLKGEQGKPKIKPDKDRNNTADSDISSEKERKEEVPRSGRSSIKDKITINRTQVCKVDKAQLPDDARFNGYETVTVQDLKIETDNIEFHKETYYSPLEHKTYRGELPPGYEGGFGPTVKAIALIMKNICNVSEPKIGELLHALNIRISSGSISNILIKKKESFHQEKHGIIKAGLMSTPYQQMDDTGARVNGQNYYTHILCNPLYTAYVTAEKKNRLTIIEVLQNGSPLKYCLNLEAIEIVKQLGIAQKYIPLLNQLQSEKEYQEEQLRELITENFLSVKEYALVKITEAAAIACYHKGLGYPVVKILLCDDAPQFKIITEELALCWVHDGRLYKKLSPVVPDNAKKLKSFLNAYWEYYRKLLAYKIVPSCEFASQLSKEFDHLFSTQTGYQALDERIAKTKQKKAHLLLVLKYLELPLHNNDAELAARTQVRKRDVSLHTITDEGTQANDTFLTITQTCKKLGVNAYDYIFDRVSKTFNLPSLAEVIREKAIPLHPILSGP
ncbi:MAG: transposase [Bacteroidetes bacterium]|nr:transposase [Bacteroidota bacterium]